MNIHVDTLEYARDLEQPGIARAHAEAIAKLQWRTVGDLVEHELVTKDLLTSELSRLEAKLRTEITQSEARLREEIRNQGLAQDRRTDALMLQISALQFGGAIAAFALAAITMMTRSIR